MTMMTIMIMMTMMTLYDNGCMTMMNIALMLILLTVEKFKLFQHPSSYLRTNCTGYLTFSVFTLD